MGLLVCFCVYLMYPHYFSCFFVICLLSTIYLSSIIYYLSIYLLCISISISDHLLIYGAQPYIFSVEDAPGSFYVSATFLKTPCFSRHPDFFYWRILFQTKVWVQRCLLIMGHHFFFFLRRSKEFQLFEECCLFCNYSMFIVLKNQP